MHILLVEDHSGYREQVADILQKKITGIVSIRTAASVGEAIGQIDADYPIDLLVTDTQIQHGSCVDVLCNVRRFDYAVVCMSSDERDYRVKALKEAGFPFYCKLDDIQKLIELIKCSISASDRLLTSQKARFLKSDWFK